MKRILFTLVGMVAGYWLLSLQSMPQETEATRLLAPAQASLLSQLPTRRLQGTTPQAIDVAQEIGAQPVDSDVKQIADEHVEAHREEWGIQAHHDLRMSYTYAGPLGSVVKYKVYQGDLALTGMDVEVRVGNDRTVKGVQVHYFPAKEVDLSAPALSEQEIVDSVADRFEQVPGQSASTQMLFMPSAPGSQAVLAVAMTVRRKGAETSEPVQAIFRASDGQILDLTVARSEIK
jgi:hypothetical protein